MKRAHTVLFNLCFILCITLIFGCSKQSEQTHIIYRSMWNKTEPQGRVIAEAAEAFARETGIRVDIEFSGREIRKTLRPALEAGEKIDLFDDDIEIVLTMWSDFLLPLDEYAAKAYSTTDGKPYRSAVNKNMYNLAKELGGGKVKAVPYQSFAAVTMYNKDLFTQAGIRETPKTWSEFLNVCAKLKAIGVPALTLDDVYMTCFFAYNMDRLIGERKTAAMAKSNDFSGPHILKFGKIWENMVKKGYISPNAAYNVWPAGQNEEMARGKAAMYLTGTWLPNELKDAAPTLNWGAFAWPAMSANGDGIEANMYGCQCFAINKNSEYPEEAFRFIAWLTTGEWDEILAEQSLGIPCGNNTIWPAQLADAKAVVDNTTNRLEWAVGMENNPAINVKIRDNFTKLLKGELNAEGFAEAMTK